MKNEKQNEKLGKSQNRQGIRDAYSGYHLSSIQCPSKSELLQSPFPALSAGRLWRGRGEAFLTPLSAQGGGFLFAKGPPGCSHSPGAQIRGHPPAEKLCPPENKAGPPSRSRRQGINFRLDLFPEPVEVALSGEPLPELVEGKYNNQIQQIHKNQKPNYYKLLNLKIMKKQIFILVFFVLVALANVNKSYGQVCTPSEINPSAGIEYTYSTTNAGTAAKYDWYITKEVDVLTNIIDVATTTLFTVNASTPYHNPTTGTINIRITWTAAAIVDGGPFYLALRYSESTATIPVCTVENLRVIEIKPINSFLLAFQGGMFSGTDYVATAGSNACAADVTGATVTPATPSLLLTYGQNTLYYVVTASGINGDWYPQVQLPALQSTQVYVSAEWSSVMTGAGAFTSFGAAPTGASQDLLSTTPATASVAGTPILIKVVINNVNWQTLADQGIELGLDGYLPPSPVVVGTNKSDITSASDCTPLAAFGRKATFTINKRPAPTGTPAFIAVTN